MKPGDRKRCSKCRRPKDPGEFPANARSPDGRSYWCRDCHRDLMRRYRQTEAGKAAVSRYNARPDVKAKQAEYARIRARRERPAAVRGAYEATPARRLMEARRAAVRRLGAEPDPAKGALIVALIVGHDRELERIGTPNGKGGYQCCT